MHLFIDTYLQVFFVLTPFAVLSAYLALTRNRDRRAQTQPAWRVTGAVMVIVLCLYGAGQYIFAVYGVTLDAFRVGAGVLLFLSAIGLVQGKGGLEAHTRPDEDVAVVPLAMPIMVGPATTGILLVMGSTPTPMTERLLTAGAMLCAVLTVCSLLLLAAPIERRLGAVGISILSKLTGLMLTAMAAQIIATGVKGLMR